MSEKRGVLGSDIVGLMVEHEIDPVFVAEKVNGRLVLALARDDDFNDFGQDIWDQGVPFDVIEGMACKVCGREDACSWVDEDLCSNCALMGTELDETEALTDEEDQLIEEALNRTRKS